MFALPISKPRFKALFFIKMALKFSYFRKKMQKFRALGAEPPDPHWPPAAGGSSPDPKTAPHCEFLATSQCLIMLFV